MMNLILKTVINNSKKWGLRKLNRVSINSNKKMGLFDFFESKSIKQSIDLTDYKFLSDDHTINENGSLINAKNKGVWRGISFKTFDNSTS